MSTIQTFSRLALKQFCVLLEEAGGHSSGGDGDLEAALWTKMMAGNPAAESIRIPYPLLKKTLRKLKIELPYMPSIINYNIGCSALKVSGGLYLPCCGVCEEESAYCGVCSKQEVKYGVMEDRGDVGTYSDPFDKHEISYGTWLAKTEKTLDEVYEALQSEGFELVIPSHYLTVNSKRIVKEVKARKGRPKAAKKEVTGDSDSGSASESEEKPKKSKKSKKSSTDPELFETVVDGISTEESPAKAKKPKAEKSKKTKSPKGSDADEEKPKKPKAEKPKKAKSPKGSDADSDAEKPKKPKADKSKKTKGSDADSDAEKPKKPKAEKPKKAKGSDSDSDGEKVEKKEKKEKKEKSKTNEPKADKKEKKAKSPKGPENSSDMSTRFGAELTTETYVPSGFDARMESFGDEGDEETVWIEEVAYILRGKRVFDTETGEKVGELGADGKYVMDEADEF
jgi:hypothetical protein